MSDVELINLYWTTCGMLPGQGEISRYDFKDRVEAAARAGFVGVGLWHTDLEHVMLHRSLKDIKAILDDNGIKHLELEFLTDWFLDGGRKRESDNRKRRLLRASEALQAHHIKIGDFYRSTSPMSAIVEAFAALCKEAREHGVVIGFEPMPSSMINNLQDSLRLVETAGAANGGLILDISHMVNMRVTLEEIARIAPRHLVCVELNDGSLPGSPGHNPSARRFCGEGRFDVRGFVDAVRGCGYDGPWALEVFGPDSVGLPLGELNDRAFRTSVAAFKP